MVMSIGYNPVYENTERSAEVHVLHEFGANFYGVEMWLLIAGFIREEKDYPVLEALIEDINIDCDVARNSLDREAWALRETGKGTLDGSWLVREAVEENLLLRCRRLVMEWIYYWCLYSSFYREEFA
jgi:riboflavin kinase